MVVRGAARPRFTLAHLIAPFTTIARNSGTGQPPCSQTGRTADHRHRTGTARKGKYLQRPPRYSQGICKSQQGSQGFTKISRNSCTPTSSTVQDEHVLTALGLGDVNRNERCTVRSETRSFRNIVTVPYVVTLVSTTLCRFGRPTALDKNTRTREATRRESHLNGGLFRSG